MEKCRNQISAFLEAIALINCRITDLCIWYKIKASQDRFSECHYHGLGEKLYFIPNMGLGVLL